MNKILSIPLIISFILFSACTNEVQTTQEVLESDEIDVSEEISTEESDRVDELETEESSLDESATEEIPSEQENSEASKTSSYTTNFPSHSLVSTGGGASCFSYEIQDEEDNRVFTNDEIEAKLSCLSGGFSFSPNNRFIVYENWNQSTKYYDLRLFDFSDNSTSTLMSFNATMDGLGCLWEENTDGVACVVINQNDYPASTKIFYLSINENGELLEKKRFVQNHENVAYFTCGSVCFPHDFWIEGDYIKYQVHPLISEDEDTFINLKFR